MTLAVYTRSDSKTLAIAIIKNQISLFFKYKITRARTLL